MKVLVQFKVEKETRDSFDKILKNRTRSQALRDYMEKLIEEKKAA